MVNGLFCFVTLTDCRGGHTVFVHTGGETSDTGAEAGKPNSGCSEGHSKGVGAGFGDESAESCGVVCPLHILLVIHGVLEKVWLHCDMHESMACLSAAVGRRHPVTIRKASLMVGSIRCV